MQKIKELMLTLINHLPGGRLFTGFYFLRKNHLAKSGWRKSVSSRLPSTHEGLPLPWFTYSSIHFLESRLHPSLTVFEYGSGNSTLWFSSRVQKVCAVEHDLGWHAFMKEKFSKLPNAVVTHKDLDSGAYEKEILKFHKQFDIIVLDGRNRVACSKNSLAALKDGGVLIWDNADRAKYKEGYDFLISNGFKRLDFYGMGPISAHSWCTSVFYKSENCLSI